MGISFSSIAALIESVSAIEIGTTVGAIVTDAAVGAALSYAGQAVLGGKSSFSAERQKQVFKQSVPPRAWFGGKVRIGGPYFFLDDSESVLYQGILLNQGRFNFTGHYLGDDAVSLDPVDHHVTSPAIYTKGGFPYAWIDTQPGDPDQTNFTRLTSAFPEWTTQHRLRGIACALVAFKSPAADEFTKVFPSGLPGYNAVGEAGTFWDPRNESQDPDNETTWTYTNNGVLMVMDRLWSQDGLKLPRAMIETEIELWKAQADIADELVDLKSGGTVKRYMLGGGYTLDQPAKTWLPLMLAPMDARLFLTEAGGIGIDVGKYVAPILTLTDAHILSYSGFSRSAEPGDLKNEIRATFVSEDNDFQEAEADIWRNQASIDIDGLQSETLDLRLSPNHSQTRRIQKINAYRLAPDWSGQVVTDAWGLRLLNKRRFMLDSAEIGVTGVFEIQDGGISNVLTGECTYDVIYMPPPANAWNPATEEGTAPVKADAPTAPVISAPESLFIAIQTFVISGGTLAAKIDATVPDPGNASLSAVMEWRDHDPGVADDEAVWTSLTVNQTPQDDGARHGLSAIMAEGNYDVRAKFTAPFGSESDFIYSRDIPIDYSALPPTLPSDSGVDVTTAGHGVVSWRNPTSPNFGYCKVFRGGSADDFADATAVSGEIGGGLGADQEFDDTPAAGSYLWWIVAYSTAGIAADPIGPIAGTVT